MNSCNIVFLWIGTYSFVSFSRQFFDSFSQVDDWSEDVCVHGQELLDQELVERLKKRKQTYIDRVWLKPPPKNFK